MVILFKIPVLCKISPSCPQLSPPQPKKKSFRKTTQKKYLPAKTQCWKIINIWWTMHCCSVIVIITILLCPLSFSLPFLIWLQLVISYISQSAFQQPPENKADTFNGTSCFIQLWVIELKGERRQETTGLCSLPKLLSHISNRDDTPFIFK